MSSEQPGGTPGSGAMSDRMRALLSRAAEEQLHEQRQVSTVLGELRSLVEDVDERLATGSQVEHVAAEVRALSARVDERLAAAEARSTELAERITEATAMVGRAAQDLVEAVAAGVAERVEAQLREVAAGLTASVEDAVAGSERRLAVHVDDAVLALAEVVLRRRRPVAPAPPVAQVEVPPLEAVPDEPGPAEEPGEPEEAPAAPPEPAAGEPVAEVLTLEEPAEEDVTAPEAPDPPTSSPLAEVPPAPPGFVLVPADVEQPDAGPAAPVQQERRTAERRTSDRSDGSGRRRRPWWRPA